MIEIKRESYPQDAKFFIDCSEECRGWFYYSSNGLMYDEPNFCETENKDLEEIPFNDYVFLMQLNANGIDNVPVVDEMIKRLGR